MANKILVVDDSLTIQKVIGITLGNDPYDLVECLDEESLLEKLDDKQVKLVLLDYNISDIRPGHQLSQEIKTRRPDISIIGMLGTFDTVDQDVINSCGISGTLVKPFESVKFLSLVRELMSDGNESDFSIDDEFTDDEDSNEWIVNSPNVVDNSVTEVASEKLEASVDNLSNELAGWGISVPEVIGDTEIDNSIMPPVIGGSVEKLELEVDQAFDRFESAVVETTEEFEDESSFSDEEDIGSSPEDLKNVKLTSQLISLDDLEEGGEEFDLDEETRPDISLRADNYDEIQSELDEDMEADELWALDDSSTEEVMLEAPAKVQETEKLEVDVDEVTEAIKESLTPVIEELVKKYCREKVEEVAWEIIPDLAENLIRKEIEEISNNANV